MKEKRILVITSVLPIDEIRHKKDENDILLETEKYLIERYDDISFHYIFTIPKTFRFIGWLSQKWESYYKLEQKKQTFTKGGKLVDVLGYFVLPKTRVFEGILTRLSLYTLRRRVQKIIEEFNPTVVHAHTIRGASYLARFIKNNYHIPYIVTTRGVNEKTKKNDLKVLEDARYIITLSPYQHKTVKAFSGKDAFLIPHGVPESYHLAKESTVREHSIDQIRFISVCRLIASKNIADNIKALARISGNFVYHIYGRGPERENLQSLIQQYGLENKIEIKGFVENDQLPSMLVSYDLFILPSYPESLGRVYLESLACGVPVIACKDTGVDGIITNGNDGFLVGKNDVDTLTSILTEVIKNPDMLDEMKIKSKERAKDFKWSTITEYLYKLYS